MTDRNYDIDLKMFKDGKKIITHQSQDCDKALQEIKELREVSNGKTEYGYHVAKIPMLFFYQWGLEDAGDQFAYIQGRHNKDPELAKKLAIRLNSNEFNQLRIWDGTIASSDMLKEGNKH